LELIDENTQATYVIVRAEEFWRLAAGNELRGSYFAQIESAMRAGWDDPRMDDYDDYDAHRGRT
jgi:hypothetical protein